MRFLIDITDPLGRRVLLDEGAYRHHIVLRHPEMEGEVATIRAAVEAPLSIWDVGGSRNIFIGRNGWWVEVIVEFGAAEYGVIITAWGSYAPPTERGAQIWP